MGFQSDKKLKTSKWFLLGGKNTLDYLIFERFDTLNCG